MIEGRSSHLNIRGDGDCAGHVRSGHDRRGVRMRRVGSGLGHGGAVRMLTRLLTLRTCLGRGDVGSGQVLDVLGRVLRSELKRARGRGERKSKNTVQRRNEQRAAEKNERSTEKREKETKLEAVAADKVERSTKKMKKNSTTQHNKKRVQLHVPAPAKRDPIFGHPQVDYPR